MFYTDSAVAAVPWLISHTPPESTPEGSRDEMTGEVDEDMLECEKSPIPIEIEQPALQESVQEGSKSFIEIEQPAPHESVQEGSKSSIEFEQPAQQESVQEGSIEFLSSLD